MTDEQKKLLKQIQKDPKLFQMVKNMQNIQNIYTSKTPKERLHERLYGLQNKRAGSFSKDYQKEKRTEIQKEKLQKKFDKEENIFNPENEVNDQIKRSRRNKLDRLKKLEKKYGTISEEVYANSILELEKSDLKTDIRNHYENIVSLYLKQQQVRTMNDDNETTMRTLSDIEEDDDE